MARSIDAADSLSHRTMLMVLYSTGMRNAELRHLHVSSMAALAANPLPDSLLISGGGLSTVIAI